MTAVPNQSGRASIRGGQHKAQALFGQAQSNSKNFISNMTDNLIKAHHDKMQDKENKQKLSNKPASIS